jgi:hypothetical protein
VKLSRRDALLALGAAVLWAWAAPGCAPSESPLARAARRLADSRRARPAAARLGRAYLAGLPQTPEIDALVASLCGNPEPDWPDEAALRTFLAERVGRDFDEGTVVEAAGWVLAESEARLYAVVALVDAAAESRP